MVFKANFSEKVDEVRHQLHTIKKASSELQASSRLARILEVTPSLCTLLSNVSNAMRRSSCNISLSLSYFFIFYTESNFCDIFIDIVIGVQGLVHNWEGWGEQNSALNDIGAGHNNA